MMQTRTLGFPAISSLHFTFASAGQRDPPITSEAYRSAPRAPLEKGRLSERVSRLGDAEKREPFTKPDRALTLIGQVNARLSLRRQSCPLSSFIARS